MKNRDMPANPIVGKHGSITSVKSMTGDERDNGMGGLTKLEYAAIQIMAGNQSIPGTHNRPKTASFDAVEKANALFDELEKQENE